MVKQIEWSDLGGVLSGRIVVSSMERFGCASMMARMRRVIQTAMARNVVAPV